MILDSFNLPREIYMLIESVTDVEKFRLYQAVLCYIYNNDEFYASTLQYDTTKSVYYKIKQLLEKRLERARKSQERKNERKAHPEKFPPRKRRARRAGVYELPSGHVVEIDHVSKDAGVPFDYYCRSADGRVMYFRKVGEGSMEGERLTFTSTACKLTDIMKSPARHRPYGRNIRCIN